MDTTECWLSSSCSSRASAACRPTSSAATPAPAGCCRSPGGATLAAPFAALPGVAAGGAPALAPPRSFTTACGQTCDGESASAPGLQQALGELHVLVHMRLELVGEPC
jgi:hypothetical protein